MGMLAKGGLSDGDGTVVRYAVFVIRSWCRSVQGNIIGTDRHSTLHEQRYALPDVWTGTDTVHVRGGEAARHRGVMYSIMPYNGKIRGT